jgi:hypothetical protein
LRYPQFYSRVGFAHPYRALMGEELSFVLTRHWRACGLDLDDADFTDAQAIASIERIECSLGRFYPDPDLRPSWRAVPASSSPR